MLEVYINLRKNTNNYQHVKSSMEQLINLTEKKNLERDKMRKST